MHWIAYHHRKKHTLTPLYTIIRWQNRQRLQSKKQSTLFKAVTYCMNHAFYCAEAIREVKFPKLLKCNVHVFRAPRLCHIKLLLAEQKPKDTVAALLLYWFGTQHSLAEAQAWHFRGQTGPRMGAWFQCICFRCMRKLFSRQFGAKWKERMWKRERVREKNGALMLSVSRSCTDNKSMGNKNTPYVICIVYHHFRVGPRVWRGNGPFAFRICGRIIDNTIYHKFFFRLYIVVTIGSFNFNLSGVTIDANYVAANCTSDFQYIAKIVLFWVSVFYAHGVSI